MHLARQLAGQIGVHGGIMRWTAQSSMQFLKFLNQASDSSGNMPIAIKINKNEKAFLSIFFSPINLTKEIYVIFLVSLLAIWKWVYIVNEDKILAFRCMYQIHTLMETNPFWIIINEIHSILKWFSFCFVC